MSHLRLDETSGTKIIIILVLIALTGPEAFLFSENEAISLAINVTTNKLQINFNWVVKGLPRQKIKLLQKKVNSKYC